MRKVTMLGLATALVLGGMLGAEEAAKPAAAAVKPAEVKAEAKSAVAEAKPAEAAAGEAKAEATPVAKNDAPGSLKPGNQLMEEGKWAEAAAYFAGIGEQMKDNGAKKREPWRLNNLALSLMNAGKYDEAIAAANQALALKGDLASAHNTIAGSLAHTGKRDEAIASLEKAIGDLKAKKADTSKLEANLAELKNAAEVSKPKKVREAEARPRRRPIRRLPRLPPRRRERLRPRPLRRRLLARPRLRLRLLSTSRR